MNEIPDFVFACLSELADDQIVYKTTDAQYTKQQLMQEVINKTTVGKIYCSDLFRVARDLIVRKKAPETVH